MGLVRTAVIREYGANRAVQTRSEQRAQGGVPDDIESVTVSVPEGGLPLGALLKAAGMVNTSSEGVRSIEQGGCKIDGEVVKDKNTRLAVGEYVIQVGKRRFAKVSVVES